MNVQANFHTKATKLQHLENVRQLEIKFYYIHCKMENDFRGIFIIKDIPQNFHYFREKIDFKRTLESFNPIKRSLMTTITDRGESRTKIFQYVSPVAETVQHGSKRCRLFWTLQINCQK